MRYLLLDLFGRGQVDSVFISNTFLELVQVHRLLNDVANLVEIIFGHFGMLLNRFLHFHLLFEKLIILPMRSPAFGRYDLE